MLYICILLICSVVVAAVLIVRREKQYTIQLQNENRILREEKEAVLRQEATTAAHLINAQQTLKNAEERWLKEAEERKQTFHTELSLARESMRAQFEKEMLERTEQLKQTKSICSKWWILLSANWICYANS